MTIKLFFFTVVDRLESLIAWSQSKITNKQFIFLSSVLVGISAGIAVILLKYFAHSVFTFANYINGILQLNFINSILPIIGILLTVLVVDKLLGGSIEKGTSQILFAVAKKASIIPKKQMYAQIATSSLTVGLGGSAGLESPIVITGAAFGSNYAQKYKLSYKDRTLLIGCGVAAGIAAAFNAPIAGVLFAVEVLLVDASIAAFTPIMIAAATGAMVSMVALDESILLSFNKQEHFTHINIFYYILLGLFTGLISVYYSRNFQKIERLFHVSKLSIYKKAFIGSSILGGLIFIFPTLFGEGYESIRVLSQNDPGRILEHTLFKDFRNNNWVLLLFIGASMMLKVFATGLTLGSGGNGGNFAPSLFLGSYIGFFFSTLLNQIGLTKLPVSNFTIVGMAGILSGLFHAPLTAIFLIAEITGGYGLMIPLMIVASTSYAVSKRFEKHSMDVKSLVKKGNAFTSNKDTNVLSILETKSIISTDYLTLFPEDKLDRLVDLISNSDQVIFPVVNTKNELVGIVQFHDVREIIFNPYRVKYTTIKEIMTQPLATISPTDQMESVMNKFDQTKKAFLPVVQFGQYYGFISKSIALEAYRSKLKAMTID